MSPEIHTVRFLFKSLILEANFPKPYADESALGVPKASVNSPLPTQTFCWFYLQYMSRIHILFHLPILTPSTFISCVNYWNSLPSFWSSCFFPCVLVCSCQRRRIRTCPWLAQNPPKFSFPSNRKSPYYAFNSPVLPGLTVPLGPSFLSYLLTSDIFGTCQTCLQAFEFVFPEFRMLFLKFSFPSCHLTRGLSRPCLQHCATPLPPSSPCLGIFSTGVASLGTHLFAY